MELHVGWVHSADVSVLDGFNRANAHNRFAVDTWQVVTDVLQPTSWRVLAAIVAIFAVRRREVRTVIMLVIAVGGAALLSGGVKSAVGRPRPTPPVPIEHVAGASFPSGHALAAAAVATILIAISPWPTTRRSRAAATTVVILLVAAVATSRLALGVHYLTDVVAGLTLGVFWSTATVAMVRDVPLAHREQNQRGDPGSDAVSTERPQ